MIYPFLVTDESAKYVKLSIDRVRFQDPLGPGVARDIGKS